MSNVHIMKKTTINEWYVHSIRYALLINGQQIPEYHSLALMLVLVISSNVYGSVIMAPSRVRVHSVHLMNAAQCRATEDQANQLEPQICPLLQTYWNGRWRKDAMSKRFNGKSTTTCCAEHLDLHTSLHFINIFTYY